MHIGLVMECEIRAGAGPAEAFEGAFARAALAEDLDFDGVWLAEHHFSPASADASTPGGSIVSSPLMLAASLGARTERIEIGTAVLVLPLGHPIRMAEEVATVDHLTGGRLRLGVGRSAFPRAYAGYGIDYESSRARFLEYLELMRRAWTEAPLDFEGQFYRAEGITVSPRPRQIPHPPLRAAATNSETFSLMGQLGLPIFAGLRGMTTAQLEPAIEEYRAAWYAAGHAGNGDVYLRIPVFVDAAPARARSIPQASALRAYARLRESFAGSIGAEGAQAEKARAAVAESLEAPDYAALLEERLAFGTPDEVTERLTSLRDRLGLSGFLVEPNVGGMMAAGVVEGSVRLLATEVAPALRSG